MIFFFYNTYSLSMFSNNSIIIMTILIQLSLLYFSLVRFTWGFVTTFLFLLYFPYLLGKNIFEVTPDTAYKIIILIAFIFILTIFNFFILANTIREKSVFKSELKRIKDLTTFHKHLLRTLVWINKKQVIFKTIGIFVLYVLLLYNLLYTFAHLYAIVGAISNEGIAGSGKNMLDAIYFSATTFFTIGFGDITPRNYSRITKMIVIAQAILGHLITTVFWPIVIIFVFNKKDPS